jgi:AcrR family transcriptional regulator
MGDMVNHTSGRPRLTVKGARTRSRIVEKAAALIHERGVAATTLEDVKVAADVSGSQLYHYFPDKDDLVQAVIDYQADTIINQNRQASAVREGSKLGETWWSPGSGPLTGKAAAHSARSAVN